MEKMKFIANKVITQKIVHKRNRYNFKVIATKKYQSNCYKKNIYSKIVYLEKNAEL